ncbi:hypothetical protein ACJIZ3_012801 [Penstemon smallii]|uniref:Transmembrane protein n=1 Tax=Penstemon smallii TaxID=265156 RepID=A0ABD3UN47_9LAMI
MILVEILLLQMLLNLQRKSMHQVKFNCQMIKCMNVNLNQLNNLSFNCIYSIVALHIYYLYLPQIVNLVSMPIVNGKTTQRLTKILQ